MNLNNKEYSKIRKDMETDEIWDLCIILEEITGKSHRTFIERYKSIGKTGILGVIIAEIRRRKYEGDKMRSKMERYRDEISRLRQTEMFKEV